MVTYTYYSVDDGLIYYNKFNEIRDLAYQNGITEILKAKYKEIKNIIQCPNLETLELSLTNKDKITDDIELPYNIINITLKCNDPNKLLSNLTLLKDIELHNIAVPIKFNTLCNNTINSIILEHPSLKKFTLPTGCANLKSLMIITKNKKGILDLEKLFELYPNIEYLQIKIKYIDTKKPQKSKLKIILPKHIPETNKLETIRIWQPKNIISSIGEYVDIEYFQTGIEYLNKLAVIMFRGVNIILNDNINNLIPKRNYINATNSELIFDYVNISKKIIFNPELFDGDVELFNFTNNTNIELQDNFTENNNIDRLVLDNDYVLDSIKRLNKLVYLELLSPIISEIPDWVMTLKKLKSILVSKPYISKLPKYKLWGYKTISVIHKPRDKSKRQIILNNKNNITCVCKDINIYLMIYQNQDNINYLKNDTKLSSYVCNCHPDNKGLPCLPYNLFKTTDELVNEFQINIHNKITFINTINFDIIADLDIKLLYKYAIQNYDMEIYSQLICGDNGNDFICNSYEHDPINDDILPGINEDINMSEKNKKKLKYTNNQFYNLYRSVFIEYYRT